MVSKTAGKSGGKTGGTRRTKGGKLSKYMKTEDKHMEHTCAIRLLDRVTPSSRMQANAGGKTGDMSRMSGR